MSYKRVVLLILTIIGIIFILVSRYIPSIYHELELRKQQFTSQLSLYGLWPEADVLHVRNVVASTNGTMRRIMWDGVLAHDNSYVEYGVATNGVPEKTQQEFARERWLQDKDISIHTYDVLLMKLHPNTTYAYRIVQGNTHTQWYTFTTDDESHLDALIFPDSQSNNYSKWSDTVRTARNRHNQAKLFINMGDLVDNGEDLSQWNAWFNAVEPMAPNIAFAPVMGNHETYTLDWQTRMPLTYLHYFYLPSNGTESYKNQHYSFDYGPVHFMVLNTQSKELAQWQPTMIEDQIQWIREDRARSKKPWQVVLMHKDLFTYAFQDPKRKQREPGFSPLGQQWMPIFDELGIDLVLTAHLHTYRNRGHVQHFERSHEGPLYILTGVAGNVTYDNLWAKHPLDHVVAPQPDTQNYLHLNATPNQLTIHTYLVNDHQLIDTVELTK